LTQSQAAAELGMGIATIKRHWEKGPKAPAWPPAHGSTDPPIHLTPGICWALSSPGAGQASAPTATRIPHRRYLKSHTPARVNRLPARTRSGLTCGPGWLGRVHRLRHPY